MILNLSRLARTLTESGAQSFYLRASRTPELITDGAAAPLDGSRPYSNEELEKFLLALLKQDKLQALAQKKQLAFQVNLGDLGPFRVVVALEGLHYSLRLIRGNGTADIPGNGSAGSAATTPAATTTTASPAHRAPRSQAMPVPERLRAAIQRPQPAASAGEAAPSPRRAPPERVQTAPAEEPEPEAASIESAPSAAPLEQRPVGKASRLEEPGAESGSGNTVEAALELRGRPPRPVPDPGAEALLHELMGMLLDQSGSDIHLKQGRPPSIRIHGTLTVVKPEPLEYPTIWGMCEEIAGPKNMVRFIEDLQLDIAYRFKDLCRFRANLYWDLGGLGVVLRIIPFKIPFWRDLGLPDIARDMTFREHGLVLVTGPTGSGKSTTLAALMSEINDKEYKHIITLEEPIEFIHNDKRCSVVQREVGIDTPSFAQGLIDAMRQDPDIILVGEMRDYVTMANALMAAEAGRLVLATLHTTSAAQTVERILNVFPEEQQGSARYQLAQNLVGTVSQALLPKKGGGRVGAFEIMVATPSIRAAIRENKAYLIANTLETSASEGMRSLDQHLLQLLEDRKIDYEAAYSHCQDPMRFKDLAAQYSGGSL